MAARWRWPPGTALLFFRRAPLCVSLLATLRERELYRVAEGWERGSGASVDRDGGHAYFVERRADGSRLRTAALSNGKTRTVLEASFPMANPIARPGRPQVLYRQGDEALWVADTEGKPNRRLKLAEGRIGPANWAPDGKTILYLNFPSDRAQLNAIREYAPETETDRLVARTSQFVHFGFNRDTSVFAGASRNAASPVVLLLLRVTRRELTLCEHQAEPSRDCGAPVLTRQPEDLLPERPRRQAGALWFECGSAGGKDRGRHAVRGARPGWIPYQRRRFLGCGQVADDQVLLHLVDHQLVRVWPPLAV